MSVSMVLHLQDTSYYDIYLKIWALKTCHQDISKIVIASGFKHGQLTEDDCRLKKIF